MGMIYYLVEIQAPDRLLCLQIEPVIRLGARQPVLNPVKGMDEPAFVGHKERKMP
jgi:hypothetical protein